MAPQVTSIKEVLAITKSLLEIRNMEVTHLQEDMGSMEGKLANERQRQELMTQRVDKAVGAGRSLAQPPSPPHALSHPSTPSFCDAF